MEQSGSPFPKRKNIIFLCTPTCLEYPTVRSSTSCCPFLTRRCFIVPSSWSRTNELVSARTPPTPRPETAHLNKSPHHEEKCPQRTTLGLGCDCYFGQKLSRTESCHARGGALRAVFSREILLAFVLDSINGCSNAIASDK